MRTFWIGIEVPLGQGKTGLEFAEAVLEFNQLLSVEQVNGCKLLELSNAVVFG